MDNRVLVLFNAVTPELRRGPYADCFTWPAIYQILRAVRAGGNKVTALNLKSQSQLRQFLERTEKPHLAFILAEGFLEEPETLYDGNGAALIRNIVDEYGLPYSHSTPAVMKICRHKHLTHLRLHDSGLPVPNHYYLDPRSGALAGQVDDMLQRLRFPLFVKPDGGGASTCIDENSIVHTPQQLLDRMKYVFSILGEVPLLVETYLPGREYTVGVIGHRPPLVLPPLSFTSERVRSLQVKLRGPETDARVVTPREERFQTIYQIATGTFDAIGACDAIRIDLREDEQGKLRVIDVNGTPSLSPQSSLAFMAAQMGIGYTEFINLVLYQSMSRQGILPGPKMQALVNRTLEILNGYRGDAA